MAESVYEKVLGFFKRQTEKNQLEFQAFLSYLKKEKGWGAVLEGLHDFHSLNLFIQDDLRSVIRQKVCPTPQSQSGLLVQYNPRRAARYRGAGRKVPPPGYEIVNDGCFLCPKNLVWQQAGREKGFRFELQDSTPYHLFPNPFPFHPYHMIAVSEEHLPQHWKDDQDARKLLRHLLEISAKYSDSVVLWNGEQAGASIPGHRHFQIFRQWPEVNAFPLEGRVDPRAKLGLAQDYPLAVVYAHGGLEETVLRLGEVVKSWIEFRQSQSSGNLIATRRQRRFRSFFVPRDRTLTPIPGFEGVVGGLEILGEVVLSSPYEAGRLDSGELDYETLTNILAASQSPEAARFCAELFGRLRGRTQ